MAIFSKCKNSKMYKIAPILYCFFFLVLARGPEGAAQSAPAFQLPENDLIPEGITWDETGNTFYVGSLFKRKIVRRDSQGRVSDFVPPRYAGLGEVTGMKINNKERKLYACSNIPDSAGPSASLHVFDLASGKLLKAYTLPGKGHFFNDLYLARSGDIYITDTESGALYRVAPHGDSLDLFLPPGTLPYANGITANKDESLLYIATHSDKGIMWVDVATRHAQGVGCRYLLTAMDGLYFTGDALIAVQNTTFPEGIIRATLSPDGKSITRVTLLDEPNKWYGIPTTGVVAGAYFYFIANSQLDQYAGNGGKLRNPGALRPVQVLRVKL